jgi:CheY-like chemotaxis protein
MPKLCPHAGQPLSTNGVSLSGGLIPAAISGTQAPGRQKAGGRTMRILIVEDDALIAMDLEDIVQARTGAECLLAATVDQALAHVSQGVDFALLDVNLRPAGATSQPIAERLQAMGVRFAFVTANPDQIPANMRSVPHVQKPFHHSEIEKALPRTSGGNGGLPRYAKPEAGAWATSPRHQA